MSSTCQLIDRSTGALLFDLNDPTGANTAGDYSNTAVLATIDLGTPAFEFSRFSPAQGDGGTTTFSRAGFRQVSVPFRMRAATYDNLAEATNRLAAVVQQPCRLKWIANNSSVTKYIDVEPSPTPYFIDGRELGVYLATSLVDTPDGIELVLTTQPFWFGDTILDNTNLFTNPTLLRDADGAGRPDGWGWSSTANITNETITDTTRSFQFDMAVSGANRSLTNSTTAATVAVSEVWVVSGYARVTSSSMTNARAQAMLTWRTSAPADISTIASTLTTLTTAWQRFEISGTAPATTDRIQGGLRFNNTSATSATIQIRNIQVEEAAAATPFNVGRESFTVEPAPTSGMGRFVPIWNPGSAPTPMILSGTNTTTPAMFLWGPMTSGNMVSMLNTAGANIQQIEDWTNGTDTAGSVQANASPGTGTSAKLTTFAGTATMATRATRTITTGLSALQGRSWIPLLRIAAGTSTLFGDLELWLDYGASGTPSYQGTAEIGSTGLTVGTYIEIPLAPVTFPDVTTGGMLATLRAARASGTGQLIWDCITWVPAEVAAFTKPTSSASITSDPGANFAYDGATVGTTVGRAAEVRGPLPMMAPPGLSLVYMASGTDWYAAGATDAPWGSFVSVLSAARSIRTQLAPRYAV